MSMNPDDFFGSAGGDYAPGWWTGQVGNSISGTIVEDPVVMDQTDFNTQQPIYEERNGQRVIDPATGQPKIKKMLKVVLQTSMRNWEGLKNAPVDPETRQPRNPAEDDGRRAVYVRGWMVGAVGDAVKAAGQTGAPRKGGKLAVRVTELAQSTKPGGNPFPKFEARYQPPAPGDSMFEEAQQGQAPQQPPQAPPAQQGQWGPPPAQQQGQFGGPQQAQAPQQQWGPQQGQQAPQQAPAQQAQAWNPPQQPQAPQQQAGGQDPWSAPPAPAQPGDPWGGQQFSDEPPF